MSGPPCDTAPIIASYDSFFTWLKGSTSCPTKKQVFDAINAANKSTGSTDLSVAEQQIKNLNSQIATLQKDVEISKDRATMVARPEATASYYDSWFPLNRPLKHLSVPILIGFATLFFTLALILLLELLGIKIIMQAYIPYNVFKGTSDYKTPYYTMTFFAAIFFVLTLYLFLR